MNGYAQLAALRYQVFVLEQGIPAELEFDGKDIPQQTYYLFLDQKDQ